MNRLRLYKLSSASGTGYVAAAVIAVQETNAEPSDPSGFFMMG